MVSVDWTLWIQIGNFIILIFILNTVLYKPIRSIMLQRKAKIEGLEDGIDSAEKDVCQKDQAFNDGIKHARAKGQKHKESMLQAAGDEERKLIDRINTDAKKDMDTMKARIAKDTDAVKASLEKEVDLFADAISRKILGRAA